MSLTVKTEQHFWRQQIHLQMVMKEFLFFFYLNPPDNHFIEGIHHAAPLGGGGDKNYFWSQG